jgi:hypothetical protein
MPGRYRLRVKLKESTVYEDQGAIHFIPGGMTGEVVGLDTASVRAPQCSTLVEVKWDFIAVCNPGEGDNIQPVRVLEGRLRAAAPEQLEFIRA